MAANLTVPKSLTKPLTKPLTPHKPCPFCGGFEPKFKKVKTRWMVYCKCGVTIAGFTHRKYAKTAWNLRAGQTPIGICFNETIDDKQNFLRLFEK